LRILKLGYSLPFGGKQKFIIIILQGILHLHFECLPKMPHAYPLIQPLCEDRATAMETGSSMAEQLKYGKIAPLIQLSYYEA
jgi:hypothetical protein